MYKAIANAEALYILYIVSKVQSKTGCQATLKCTDQCVVTDCMTYLKLSKLFSNIPDVKFKYLYDTDSPANKD